MKKLLCLSLMFCTVTGFAQNDTEKAPLLMGDALSTFRYENIQGHPFLKNEWSKSVIVMNDKKMYDNVMLKMDLYQNNFVFNRREQEFILTPDAVEVRLVNDLKPTDKIIFRRGYLINKFIKPSNFVQVLADGKLSFLKFIKKNMEEYTEYNDATKYQRFKLVEQYFIKRDDEFISINLTKKSMETAFASKWLQMDAWIKQNNISGKDESSWILATNYYNTL